jgi:hypothetical protein
MSATIDDARAAQQRLAAMLGDVPEVNGIGITRAGDGFALKLNLTSPAAVEIPAEVDGVSVRVDVVGPAVAY